MTLSHRKLFFPHIYSNRLTEFPTSWQRATSKRIQNLLESSRWNTLKVRVGFWNSRWWVSAATPALTLVVFSFDNTALDRNWGFICKRRSAHHLWPFLCCSACLLSADEKLKRETFFQHFTISTDHTDTICWLFFFFFFVPFFCSRKSFTQHNVGGCPHVSVCSICVGCLLGSALLWIGHWRAQALRMQSDRCRLVGAWLQTARRQARYRRLEIWKRTLQCCGLSSVCASVHFPDPWTPPPPPVCLHLMSQVLWIDKIIMCGMIWWSFH